MSNALTPNAAAETIELDARQAQEEIVLLRLENELRFGTPIGACPWGCDGSGVKEIALHEYAPWEAIPDVSETVWPHGLIVTPCECSYHGKKGGQDDEAREGASIGE